jgi:GTPase SAR1 family protein
MSSTDENLRPTSALLLPELQQIGNSLCYPMQFGMEDELLGKDVMERVRPAIQSGDANNESVVRIALLSDVLRIVSEAVVVDGKLSDAEITYVTPIVNEGRKCLSAFRPREELKGGGDAFRTVRFLRDFRIDSQLFGGACAETRWLGLNLVRRLAEETSDREPLERYTELMLRVSEEIIALDTLVGSRDEARQILETRLGLRALLRVAISAAPSEELDPRVRAFCSPEAPEVFHAIAHANQVWRRDPLDCEDVHREAREVFSRLVARASEQGDTGTGRVLLVMGEAGSGKTHLMRAFRDRVHGKRSGQVGYMQMSAPTDDYARYVLSHLLESMEKPYDEPEVSESGLMCISDGLLMAPGTISEEQRRSLREDDLADDALCDRVFELADLLVCDARFSDVDIDLMRALLFLQRREPPIYARVVKYLRCEPLGRRDLSKLGDLAPKNGGDDALRMISQLGRILERIGGGALVLLVDQLEDMFNQPNPKERMVKLLDVTRHIADNVPNSVVVVSTLRDFFMEMRASITRSVLDRVEREPVPINLRVGRSLAELEALVQIRLQYLFETQGVRFRAEDPLFPFPKTIVESISELSAREAFRVLHAFQEQCIEAGCIVDAAAVIARPETIAPLPLKVPVLAQQWTDFRAMRTPSINVPESDGALLVLMRSVLCLVNQELPQGVALRMADAHEGLIVTVPDRGLGISSFLLQITNASSRGGKLSKQLGVLNAAAKGAGHEPVAVRCSDFGGTQGSGIARELAAMTRAKGRKVVLEDGVLRTLLAYREFAQTHANHPEVADWVRAERPLLSLSALRTLLGLPTDDVTVNWVTRASIRPGPSRIPPQPRPATLRPPVEPVRTTADNTNVQATKADASPVNPLPQGPVLVGVTTGLDRKPVQVDPGQLKKHAAFLGASGSGKTSLALNVIEQLLERGVGAVLLDRKGDLAMYADPDVRGQQVGDPGRERRRRALLEKVDVRVFTPGNPDGRALRIRAIPDGLDQLPPLERTQIARFAAQSLGAMMSYRGSAGENTNLAILGKAIEVVGQMSRKRDVQLKDVIGLLAEEDESLIAEIGHLEPKLFKRLVRDLETLRLSHSAILESTDEPLRAEMLLGKDGSVPQGKVPLSIISTKFLGDAQRVDFWVSRMLVELSRWCSRSPSTALQSVLFLDEADAYLPATSKPATKDPLQDLLKRARSAGLGIMLATQNPGDLDYKGRDNIGTWWIGRIASKTAIEKMKPLLAECRTDFSAQLANAGVGEFFQVSDGHVQRVRGERSLLETQQLSEARILGLAASLAPGAAPPPAAKRAAGAE